MESKNSTTSEKRPRVGKATIKSLGHDICRGYYPEGLLMPSENELCDKYNVSRTVIREALNVVEAKGLVSRRSRSGTKVNLHSEWSILDQNVIEWLKNTIYAEKILPSILEARRVIEPAAAKMAAERANFKDLAFLEESWDLMSNSSHDLNLFNAADLQFHYCLISSSNNRVFQQLASSFKAAIRYAIEATSQASEDLDAAILLHGELLNALRVKNTVLAEHVMLKILDMAEHDSEAASEILNTNH